MEEEYRLHNQKVLRDCRANWYSLAAYCKSAEKKLISREIFERFKKQLICIKCGNREVEVLDFHHRDPRTKEFNISMRKNGDLDKLLNEAEKCDVLCSNCHRKHHARNP